MGLLLFAGSLSGDTIRWSSPSSGGDTRFSNPSNWNKGKAPQNGDTVIFDPIAGGSAACVLDIDATIGAIVFKNDYSSLFDFNGHFLAISGNFADFRSAGEIDGVHNSGGIQFSGSPVQHFFPGKAHFPCIIVNGKAPDSIICQEIGILTDTLILNGGTLYCGDGLTHLCGEIRGNNGSLDLGSSTISVSGAGVFLSQLKSVSARSGTLVCTGPGSQIIELPADTMTVHAFIQNCSAGCVIESKSGPGICHIDSLAIQSGPLSLADSQCLTVGTLCIVHGGIQMPKSGCIIVQKLADLSGLDTAVGDIQGTLAFSGESAVLVPKAAARIASLSLLQGKVIIAGSGCNADEIHLSNASQPCTLSLGAHLTHSFRSIVANAGSVIDFGTSTLQFEGDTLDFSRCGVAAYRSVTDRSNDGAVFFSGTNPHAFIPNKTATYPSIVQNGPGGTTVCKNGFSCGRLTVLSGTFNLGKGLSHTVTDLLRAEGGFLDFGSSTLNASADTVDLTGVNDLAAGSGALSFTGATGVQLFMPRRNVLHPDITKSRNGTVRLSGALRAKNFRISAGAFDPGASRCEFTSFSAKGGTLITGSDSMIISGNADFSGLSDLLPGRAPVVVRASGNNSFVLFSSTSHTIGRLVLSLMPPPGRDARIIAGKGIHHVSRLTFQWNRSGGSAIFDFRQNNAGMAAEDSVDVRPENSGIDKGAILMGSGAWTFSGDVVLTNQVCDSSTVTFCRQDARQTVALSRPLNNVIHSGNGVLALGSPLLCRNFTQSGGIIDFKGSSIVAANDFSLLSGSGLSIAASSLSWKIVAGRNAFLSGGPDSPLAVGSAVPCTLVAAGSITVRYSALKHCAAILTKGTAYNSADSGGNSNWAFITRPLPVALSARDISFGNVLVGSSRDTIVTLSNICGDTVTIFMVSQAGAVFTNGIGSHKIPPHGLINDTILYAPDNAGPDSGRIIFLSNSESSPDTVLLHGSGRGPRLHHSTDTVSFGAVVLLKSMVRTVVLKNTGTDTMLVSQSIQSTGRSADFDSVFSVSRPRACAPGDSFTDTIRFSPAKEGLFSAFLIMKTNCPVPYDTIMIIASGSAGVSDDQTPAAPGSFSFQEISTTGKSVLFKYAIPFSSKVALEIYDAIGRFLERPIESVFGPSEYQFVWDASHLSRGIYFCRMKATDGSGSENRFVKTIRVIFP
jgi:hypothetical protein